MRTKKSNRSNLLIQGSILAMASVISRIIGLIYRIPLTAIIGDIGNDYYGCAFEIYNILLMISSYSLPTAVSKLVSEEISRGHRKNAYRLIKCAFLFALISGVSAGCILFFGAEFITTTIMKTPYSIFAVRVLAPTLLVVAVLGVVRGFFQGLGTMMPSAISQILEQIVNAIVSVWTAYVLFSRGAKIGAILGNPEKYSAAYGAMGGTIGTGAGAVFALLFVGFVYVLYMKVYKQKMRHSREKEPVAYRDAFRILLVTIFPILLCTTIYNCSSVLDQILFKNIATAQGYDVEQISIWWGKYSGKYRTLINIPISIAAALAASAVPNLAASFSEKKEKQAILQMESVTHFVMLIALPCTVGLIVLASPILQLLFQDNSDLAAQILQVGAVATLFFSLSTLSNGLLQGMNRIKEPMKNAFLSLIAHIILLCVMMYFLKWNIYAVIYANIAFALFMCLLNAHSIKKYTGYQMELKKSFILTGLASIGMGGVMWLVYFLLEKAVHNNTISVLVSILLGIISYFILLVLFRGVDEQDMRKFPKGDIWIRIAKKLHLLR